MPVIKKRKRPVVHQPRLGKKKKERRGTAFERKTSGSTSRFFLEFESASAKKKKRETGYGG